MKTITSFRSKLFALTLALMASVSSFANDYHGDFLCYTILTDSTVSVIGQSEYKTMPRYEYLPENLIIPSEVTLQGKIYKVVSIDPWAFYACNMLKSVIIPSSVTFIGLSAFQYCENLASVEIPTSVTIVEGSAFSYTKWFDNLPDGEVYINNTLYRYKGTAPENTKIVVKNGTTRIARFTFWNQPNIVAAELPQTLTIIEHGAFQMCTQLSSILIPKNVTFIGGSAFADCTGLKKVTCLATTPPTVGSYSDDDWIFSGVDVNNVTLYVPIESVEAYKNAEQWKEFGQILPIEESPQDLFPTLWGLQRTSCDEWFDGCEENKSYLFAPKEIKEINGKQYLKCGGIFLREEDSKVLIYSFPYEKDLVLYDYTLEVGDRLQSLGIDVYSFPELEYAAVVDYIAFEEYDEETGELIIKKEPLGSKRVSEVSTITLLDGKEYKRWLFGNDWENGNYYIESIGNVGGSFGGDYIYLANPYGIPTCYLGERLVCASRNGQLLYQMDEAEMERLGAECLCDINVIMKDNAKDGKIGGRPTPTQWNLLEVVLRKMDNNQTILRAETFSYTLEDNSQEVNNRTYFDLARQSTKDTAITKSIVGALHFGKDEDNRVYFLRDGHEYVLYDFTAEVGDTLQIFAGINNYPQDTTYTHVVTGKDTLADGACRMILKVVFPDETNTTAENAEKVWLAGLGSMDGIVHNAAQRTSNASAAPARSAQSSDTQTSVMLCAWREDSCLYTTDHPDYDTFGCVYNQDPTGVGNIPTTATTYQKLLRDGQLLIILDNGKTYNVMGIEVE